MQVSFIFGYSMKLQSVVKTMGAVRALTLPFSTPLQNTLVHDLTVKVSIIRTPEMVSLVLSILPYAQELYTKPQIIEIYLLSVVHSNINLS